MSTGSKGPDKSRSAPDCESVVRALWDFLDAELDHARLEAIDRHLAACRQCRSHADFEQRLVDELAALRREHSDPEALRARIVKVLREASDTSGQT